MADKFQVSPKRPQFSLRGVSSRVSRSQAVDPLADAMEKIIQRSLNTCAQNHAGGIRELESTVFAKSIAAILRDQDSSKNVPVELLLLSKPVGLFEFRLHNRRYVSISHPVLEESQEGSGGEPQLGELRKSVFRNLRETVESKIVELGTKPSKKELLAVLFGHLHEACRAQDRPSDGESPKQFDDYIEMHPARRASIANWQRRIERLTGELHGRRDQTNNVFAYPILDGDFLDETYLVIFLVSPLDENFVDEKVPDDHRVSEITLAVYHVREQLYPGAVDAFLPLLKQAFGRVLFTNFMRMNSQALMASFGKLGTISRHWVTAAAKGIRGILSEEVAKAPFDAFAFCEGIVKNILCAEIEGVDNMEVYPFNRAYIFREAGVRGISSDDGKGLEEKPIEMLVLQASILSKNPADRGRYLTGRERAIRGTADFHCDASKKKIKKEDSLRFFIHGHREGLVLSRNPHLTEDEKREAFSVVHSRAESADKCAYKIGKPAEVRHSHLSAAMYNLFGPLLASATEKRDEPVHRPNGQGIRIVPTRVFTKEFGRARMETLQRYDKEGLYFLYNHGLDLEEEAELLHRLQKAFFSYESDKHKHEKEQFLRENLKERGLPKDAIEESIEYEKEQRAKERLEEGVSDEVRHGDKDRDQQTKVVYVSFSSRLHEENVQLQISNGYGKDDADSHVTLLGPEYTYTMILVTDQDPEKSLAQLRAERNDLKLYFQMLMRQIWMAKRNEYRYLEKKSRFIGESMGQVMHRARAVIGEQRDAFANADVAELDRITKQGRDEMEAVVKDLSKLVTPSQNPVTPLEVLSAKEVLLRLCNENEQQPDSTDPAQALWNLAESRFPGKFGRESVVLLPSHLPHLELTWCGPVVRDAFIVSFKNACEASLAGTPGSPIHVQVEAIPRDRVDDRQLWFVEFLVENGGGPIPEEKLDVLNGANPKPLGKNDEKDGSTGIGVWLARSQLRDVIGDGADMVITNVDNGVVQTRIRIPARSVRQEQTTAPVIVSAPQPVAEYVLYVEDTAVHYEPMLKGLERFLSKHRIEVLHARSLNGAKALIDRRMPLAVFSDLHILESDESPLNPLMKHGLAFLKALMKRSSETSRPPIMILTAEREADVRRDLRIEADSGYRFVSFDPTAVAELGEQGTVCILSEEKNLTARPFFEDLLEATVRPSRRQEPVVTDVALVQLELDGEDFSSRLAAEIDANAGNRKTLLMATGRAADLEELTGKLHVWFSHPDVRDLDGRADEDAERYPLHDHVYHKRLLLAVWLEEDLFSRVSVQLLYWCLSRNVWLTRNSATPMAVAGAWSNIRNEAKGPISVLRHDLSLWSAPELNLARQKATDETTTCDDVLLIPDAMATRVEVALSCGEGALAVMEEVLQLQGPADSWIGALDKLEMALQEGVRVDRSLEASVKRQRNMLHLLQNYLRGR